MWGGDRVMRKCLGGRGRVGMYDGRGEMEKVKWW